MEKINLNEIIDFQTALDGEIKYQKEWIEFYDKQEGEAKGKRMITTPDIYRAGKENSNVCESLREDFNYRWVATGTTILYNKDSFSGRVIHNFSSIVAKPIDISVSEIPVYQSQQIKKVVEGKGLAYVQALFNTKDNANEIISTLEKISQTGAEDICFWTPGQDSRKSYSERPVKFSYIVDRFLVLASYWCGDYGGRSRGVLLDSATQSK